MSYSHLLLPACRTSRSLVAINLLCLLAPLVAKVDNYTTHTALHSLDVYRWGLILVFVHTCVCVCVHVISV